MKPLTYDNSRKSMNQDKYNKNTTFTTDRYEAIKDKLVKFKEKK